MFTVRPAQKKDLESMIAVEAACFPPKQAAGPESMKSRFSIFPEWFMVCETEDGRIAGIIDGMTVSQRTITDNLYDNAALHEPDGAVQTVFGLAVLPEFRGQGAAGALMEAYARAAEAAGRKTVVLTCRERLIGMYEHFGFKKLGVSVSSHGGVVWYDMERKLGAEAENE